MQKQNDKKTVQGDIENALFKLNINTQITHAGRTDRGVHALNQVISFETPGFWKLDKLKNSLNSILHPYIHFKNISLAPKDFHPRFSAKKRSYRYIISKNFTPFNADYITHYPYEINLTLLKEAANLFKGTHDFEYFAKTGSSVNNYIRTIYNANIYQHKNLTVFTFCANGFLRSQIRIMTDFLLKINQNQLTINDLKLQLTKQKLISKHLAPPNGLYLHRIFY